MRRKQDEKEICTSSGSYYADTTVLSGCGGSGGDGTGTGAAAEAGNNLVVQIGPDPETMDPALNSAH